MCRTPLGWPLRSLTEARPGWRRWKSSWQWGYPGWSALSADAPSTRQERICALLSCAWAVCLIAVSFSGQFWAAMSLMGLVGVASVGVFVPSITLYQETPAAAGQGTAHSHSVWLRATRCDGRLSAGWTAGSGTGHSGRLFFVAGVATILIALVIYFPTGGGLPAEPKLLGTTAIEAGARRSTPGRWRGSRVNRDHDQSRRTRHGLGHGRRSSRAGRRHECGRSPRALTE